MDAGRRDTMHAVFDPPSKEGQTNMNSTPFKRSLLCVAIAGSLGALASPAVIAQENSAEPDENIDEVVVTGTRVATRTRLESLSPVDVLSTEALTTQATTELAEALSNAAPSLNFPRPAITDGTDHIRPATLRGLAPDQTLVLINGKRRHTSALVNLNGSIGRGSVSTDFNAIPSSMIDRIEVLRDGASAQYGSDAIAGVNNVILRKDVGWGLNLAFGQTKVGDGEDYKLDAFAGTKLGDKGSLFVDLYLRDHDATNRIQPDTRQQYFGIGAGGVPVAISGNY